MREAWRKILSALVKRGRLLWRSILEIKKGGRFYCNEEKELERRGGLAWGGSMPGPEFPATKKNYFSAKRGVISKREEEREL